MSHLLQTLLENEEIVLIDGAMGTELFARGLESGASPEEWNALVPDQVRAIHESYIEAGSRLILTNTFGGTRFRLKLHDLQDRAYELNKCAAEIARSAADAAAHDVVVAGSMGPTGELLYPMGDMQRPEAEAAFAEQTRGLVEGGVDVLWIETMSDLQEVRAAVAGIRQVTDLPICVTLTFDTRGRTMMGVTPQEAAETLLEWGVFAIGGNCGNGVEEIEGVIDQMRSVAPTAVLIAKSNAGVPKWLDNKLYYDGSPEKMARYATRVRQLGANIIGACCGSTPEHIAAMRKALEKPISEMEIEAQGFKITADEASGSVEKGRTRRRRRR